MINVKFLRGTFHLGLAHRAGDTANIDDDLAKRLIDGGYAIENIKKRRKEVEPKVETTQITRSRKRPVKK
jgi:hypothetical protein